MRFWPRGGTLLWNGDVVFTIRFRGQLSLNKWKEFSFNFFFVSDLTFLTPKGTIGQFL